jgi:hypothetical protein
MVEQSRFDGKSIYTASEFAEVFTSAYVDGVEAGSLDELKVTTIGGGGGELAVSVGTGTAWVRGTWYKNDAPLVLQIPSLGETETIRHDRVVLAACLQGRHAGWVVSARVSPGAADEERSPDLARTEAVWEIPLAQSTITKTDGGQTITITITDEREHLVTTGIQYVFDAAGDGLVTSATGDLVVPFSCRCREWCVVADTPTTLSVTVTYRTWVGFAEGRPPSPQRALIPTRIALAEASAASGIFESPLVLPQHAILSFTVTPPRVAAGSANQCIRPAQRVAIYLGVIRADR